MFSITDIIHNSVHFVHTLDLDYISWLLWVMCPIVISFLLPLIVLVFINITVLIVFIYDLKAKLRKSYTNDHWDEARKIICSMWNAQGRIWHGREIKGLDNIPSTGPALIVYYHGAIAVDFYYFKAACALEKGRQVHAVGDKYLFHIPSWRKTLEVLNVIPGSVESCVDLLRKGHLLAIAPGGVREGLFGDESYPVIWNKRTGFAKVALRANVPIIPMFTVNCREVFRTPSWARAWLRGFYEKTRIPIVPIYGCFPVKIRIICGSPIYPEPGMTPDRLTELVKSSLEELIVLHQRRPGSIIRALLERIPVFN